MEWYTLSFHTSQPSPIPSLSVGTCCGFWAAEMSSDNCDWHWHTPHSLAAFGFPKGSSNCHYAAAQLSTLMLVRVTHLEMFSIPKLQQKPSKVGFQALFLSLSLYLFFVFLPFQCGPLLCSLFSSPSLFLSLSLSLSLWCALRALYCLTAHTLCELASFDAFSRSSLEIT